ncbi:hypothetical protein NL676_004084 [Syzygium grande]|nr:hypothetical protein NL676_004084 [Syzygium grande]
MNMFDYKITVPYSSKEHSTDSFLGLLHRRRLQLRGGNLLHRVSPSQKSAPASPRASTLALGRLSLHTHHSCFGPGGSSSLCLGSCRLRPKRKKKLSSPNLVPKLAVATKKLR